MLQEITEGKPVSISKLWTFYVIPTPSNVLEFDSEIPRTLQLGIGKSYLRD